MTDQHDGYDPADDDLEGAPLGPGFYLLAGMALSVLGAIVGEAGAERGWLVPSLFGVALTVVGGVCVLIGCVAQGIRVALRR